MEGAARDEHSTAPHHARRCDARCDHRSRLTERADHEVPGNGERTQGDDGCQLSSPKTKRHYEHGGMLAAIFKAHRADT